MSRLFVDYGWSMLPMWCQFSIAAYYTVNNMKNIQRAYDTMAYLSHRVRPRGAESSKYTKDGLLESFGGPQLETICPARDGCARFVEGLNL